MTTKAKVRCPCSCSQTTPAHLALACDSCKQGWQLGQDSRLQLVLAPRFSAEVHCTDLPLYKMALWLVEQHGALPLANFTHLNIASSLNHVVWFFTKLREAVAMSKMSCCSCCSVAEPLDSAACKTAATQAVNTQPSWRVNAGTCH
jgi:hypothetical protein